MIYIESFLISLLVVLGTYCSLCDFRKGIIPNFAVIIGAAGAIIADTAYFILAGVSQLPMFLFHVASAIIIAILMYGLKIWAGGDVKMFSVMSALIPVSLLKQNIPLPAIIIFTIVFSLAFIYLIIQSFIFMIRKEKSYTLTPKFALIPFIACIVFIMSVQAVLRFILKGIYVEYIGVFLFLNIILVLAFGRMKFLHNIVCVIICSSICAASIVYDLFNQRVAFDYRSLLIVLLIIALRWFAGRYNYQEINTKDVKPGMVLSYTTIFQFSQSRVKGLPQTTTENMGSRISRDEANSIIRWADSKNGKDTIIILRKIPFAVFIAAGYLIYTIFGLLW